MVFTHESLGTALSTFRAKWGLSQRELGAEIGIHQNAISRWERDDVAPFRATNLRVRSLLVEADKRLTQRKKEGAAHEPESRKVP